MGTFGKSFSREIGKNTGKWVSNKLFGSGHSTPYRVVNQREREERRAEREEARRYRERQKMIEIERREEKRTLARLEKEMVEREKQLVIEANITEAHQHENYIKVLQSVHMDYAERMDWESILDEGELEYVQSSKELESEIRKYTNDYVDNQIEIAKRDSKLSLASLIIGKFYDKKYTLLFKLASKKDALNVLLGICIMGALYSFEQEGFLKYFILCLAVLVFSFFYLLKIGAEDFNKILKLEEVVSELERTRPTLIKENFEKQDQIYNLYLEQKKDLETTREIAKGVLNGDIQYYTYALNYVNPFEDLKDYGSDISFNVASNLINIDFYVHGEDVVPYVTKKILRNGSVLKEEPISNSRFNEIYQNYVCSCVLRIAKEVFQLLPLVDNVQVNAKGFILNTSTGNNEDETILSVKIDRLRLETFNFELLSPAGAMSNFEHRMDFKKNEGFKPVQDL
ncbi:hypothetical protein HX052_10125 [Myroides marinus]|uniref:hypothetical protein n=1 Tax=Myroides marinus TaxID=703342 RepID=UPI00257911C0|nr:hypothetical protein [Myroides marinus]MDM1368334.1 hypothetical protein [Myroides marinus]MDM1390318.1 hypothetical protein [Myroides marinus]